MNNDMIDCFLDHAAVALVRSCCRREAWRAMRQAYRDTSVTVGERRAGETCPFRCGMGTAAGTGRHSMASTRTLRPVVVLGVGVLALSTRATAEAPPSPAPAPVTLLAMPFVGFHSYQNVDMAAYAPGLRAGAIVGARLLPWLSVNLEGTYDRSFEPHVDGSSSEFFADLALSPLFHFTGRPGEMVVGPEIGYFLRSGSAETPALTRIDDSSTGLAVGHNAGAFARMGRHVSMGVLFSLELRNERRYCQTLGGQPEMCTTSQTSGSEVVLHDADLFALTLAALF
jgi:hypothetical protein